MPTSAAFTSSVAATAPAAAADTILTGLNHSQRSNVHERVRKCVVIHRTLDHDFVTDPHIVLGDAYAPIRGSVVERESIIKLLSLNRPRDYLNMIATSIGIPTEIVVHHICIELDAAPMTHLCRTGKRFSILLLVES